MSEYIKREALLKDIEEERPVNWTNSEAEIQAENDFYKYRGIVEIQPTVDAVEVKHGQWVEKPSRFGSNYKLYGCSVCGWTFTFKPDYNFCPRCGAYMKGGADNG